MKNNQKISKNFSVFWFKTKKLKTGSKKENSYKVTGMSSLSFPRTESEYRKILLKSEKVLT